MVTDGDNRSARVCSAAVRLKYFWRITKRAAAYELRPLQEMLIAAKSVGSVFSPISSLQVLHDRLCGDHKTAVYREG